MTAAPVPSCICELLVSPEPPQAASRAVVIVAVTASRRMRQGDDGFNLMMSLIEDMCNSTWFWTDGMHNGAAGRRLTEVADQAGRVSARSRAARCPQRCGTRRRR